MAELLGVVSSAITIVETAGKLVSSAIALKRLWDEVQDVPDSIRRQMQHLEMLVPVLEDMEDEFRQTRNMLRNDRAAIRSLEYCRKAMEELEVLTRDMQMQVTAARKGKRTLAKFKVTLKKGVIQQCHERLASTLQLLALSQQTYLIALTRVQPSIIVSEFQALQTQSFEAEVPKSQLVEEAPDEEETALSSSLKGKSCGRSHFMSQPSQTQSIWGNVKKLPRQRFGLLPKLLYQVSEVPGGNGFTVISRVHQLQMQLPRWLAQKAWDFQACRAYDGWKIQLTSSCIRPDDCKVFEYARGGLTDELFAMIKRGEASLHDCDQDGWTLFDYSLTHTQPELAKQLALLGAEINGLLAFFALSTHHCRFPWTDGGVLGRCQLLADKGMLDEVTEALSLSNDKPGKREVASFLWGISGLPDIARQTSPPDWDQFASGYALKIDDWYWVEPRILLDYLTHNDLVSPACFRTQLPDVLAIHSFAWAYMNTVLLNARCSLCSQLIDDMRSLARWILTGASAEEVIKMGESATPLQVACILASNGLCEDYWLPPRTHEIVYPDIAGRNALIAVQTWLGDLMEAGVDLVAYGQLEEALSGNPVYWASTSLGPLYEGGPYFTSLEYGPDDDDDDVVVVVVVDDWDWGDSDEDSDED